MPPSTNGGRGSRGGKGEGAPRRPALAKAPTGISGLDSLTRGGLPRGRFTVVFGGPGSGKTVLAVQTLVNGVRQLGESGIFVAFEEPPAQIVANAVTFGWDLPALQRQQLFFLDAQMSAEVARAGKFELTAMLAVISAKVKQLNAKRVVFDGVDVLLDMLDDPKAGRTELIRLQEWARRESLTAVLTVKHDDSRPLADTPYGFAAFMVDCALQLTRSHQGAVSERDVTVLKYRGSAFSENRVPFVIGPHGIEVAEDAPGEATVAPSTERLSTGVPRLDTMLGGGYVRGSYTLITGLPGTAKSTLCGAFTEAACKRGERCLMVSFDEPSEDRIRNLRSVAIDLRPHVKAGRLRLVSAPPLAASAEIQLMRLRAVIRDHRARFVVVDAISALGSSSSPATARGALARFVYWTKVEGITLVSACLSTGPEPTVEGASLGASTLCDAWIHVAYAQTGGERNRSLVVVKARGTNHSNQVRELILADRGIDLADVYRAGGEVLMGTMRWQQENKLRDQEQRLKSDAEAKELDLQQRERDLKSRLHTLRDELAQNRAEQVALKRGETERRNRGKQWLEAMIVRRRGDAESPRRARQGGAMG